MSTLQFPKIVFGPEFDAKVDGVSTRIRIVGCSNGAYLIKNVSEDKIYTVKPGLSLSGDSFEFEGAVSTPVDDSTPDTEPTEGT